MPETTVPTSLKHGHDLAVKVADLELAVNTLGGGTVAPSPLVVNVQASPFNAKGDAVTDDKAAIDAAIAYAATAAPGNVYGRGVVYFPPGYYSVSGSIVMNHDYVSLVGAGKLSSLLYLRSGVADVAAVLQIGTGGLVSGAAIRHLGVEGGAERGHTSGHCITLNCNDILLEHVYTNAAPQDGIRIDPTTSAFRAKAIDVYVNNPGRYGFYVGPNCFDGDFYNVEVQGGPGGGVHGGVYGIYNQGTESHFYGCHPFFMGTDGLRSDLGFVQIIGGEYESNVHAGINLQTQGGLCIVQGVTGLYGNETDLYVSQNAWPMVINGNTIRSTTGTNMWMDNTPDAVICGNVFLWAQQQSLYISQCARGTVSGNTFTPLTAAGHSIIISETSHYAVVGNNIGGTTPRPIIEQVSSDHNGFFSNSLNGTTITVIGANSVQANNF
jgi:hypothetical protein